MKLNDLRPSNEISSLATKNPKNTYAAQKKYFYKQKRILFSHYDSKCSECGNIYLEFLTLFPIDPIAKELRKKFSSNSYNLYLFLNRNCGFRSSFKSLCMNCTWALRGKDKYPGDNYHRKGRRELKKEVVKAYGGKCFCCGESDERFLTLDHPNGDGQQDRAKYRNIFGQIYGHLKKQGFPQGYYRLLCMNCNWVRRFGKTCPHQCKGNVNEL